MAADLPHPYLHTLWCDDVRHELGNKTSLMGVFAADIVVPALPIVLGKLVCHNHLEFAKGQRPRQVRFKLLMDDQVMFEQDLGLNGLFPGPGAHDAGGRSREAVHMTMMLSPLEIPLGARLLQAVAEMDDLVVHGNKLWVSVTPHPVEGGQETSAKSAST